MKVNVHNSSHRDKAFPGMPGITYTVKAGKTIQVDMPDDATPETYKRLSAHGLTFSSIVEEDAPELAPTQTPQISPPAAVEPAKGPTPKAAPKTAPKPAPKVPDAGDAAPAPWQRGLEAPK